MSQTLFENCTVLDTRAGQLLPDHHVLIEDGRIEEVSDKRLSARDAISVDVDGRTLMPGLIDVHAHPTITTMNIEALLRKPVTLVMHEARRVMEDMLGRGFTTIRDTAGADYGLATAVDRGLIDGPRIFYCGRALSQTGGHGDLRPFEDSPHLCAGSIDTDLLFHVADGVDAVRKAAREELRKGAHAIKIMASGGVASPTDPISNTQYSHDEIRAVVEEAASWHTYVTAHAYTAEAISRAVGEGVRTVEHANLIDEPTAKLMAERHAYVVPTLVAYSAIDRYGRSFNFPEVSMGKVKDVLDSGLSSIEICKKAGVRMGFGTDLLGELHEHQSEEFLIRSEVLSPMEIIQSATLVNAEILKREGELGVIAPGAVADILVVDGDPTADLQLFQDQGAHLPVIMKAGEFVVNRLAG